MDKLTAKYSTHARALPPQRIKLEKPGWAGAPDLKMVDGSEPQPWHCLPSDETGTAPLAICGHVQSEWWTRKLFVVFKSPLPGQRHIFRKGDPYVQILFVPHRVSYETQEFTPEEETARRKRETQVDAAKLHM